LTGRASLAAEQPAVPVPTHSPLAAQASPAVQVLPSLQLAPVSGACVQPEAGAQPSVVHAFESSQFGGAPPVQAPLASQVSPVVQALPSLQLTPGAGTCVQPVPWLQPSVVHGFPSSHEAPGRCRQPWTGSQTSTLQASPSAHEGGALPTHTPVESHVSIVVHALPSEQALPGVAQLGCSDGINEKSALFTAAL